MAVARRRRIPESIFMVVEPNGFTYLYHSYQHAWNLKEKVRGRLFKITTAQMEEMKV
jgi:hypothetical protein